MGTESYDQLAIFAAVAQERSFTRAAAKLGMSQPALSRAMRQLEERLGIRLLARTTRSVAPTEAGEHLLRVAAPRFEEINNELGLLSEFRDKPAGKLRITAGEHAAITRLQPVLARLLPSHAYNLVPTRCVSRTQHFSTHSPVRCRRHPANVHHASSFSLVNLVDNLHQPLGSEARFGCK